MVQIIWSDVLFEQFCLTRLALSVQLLVSNSPVRAVGQSHNPCREPVLSDPDAGLTRDDTDASGSKSESLVASAARIREWARPDGVAPAKAIGILNTRHGGQNSVCRAFKFRGALLERLCILKS